MLKTVVFAIWGSGEVQPWNAKKNPSHIEKDSPNELLNVNKNTPLIENSPQQSRRDVM